MQLQKTGRREFLMAAGAVVVAGTLQTSSASAAQPVFQDKAETPSQDEPRFQISLAQWSLHRKLQKGGMDHLDFAKMAREEFDIGGVEYVNSFFKDKARDSKYLVEMNKRCSDFGVRSVLIMVDGEGDLGAPDRAGRLKTVEKHHHWADAAKELGCHSIRVNAQSVGGFEEQQKLAADGLALLSQYCAALRLNVIVENHGGLSSNGTWLSGTIQQVGMENCGTLPDFGNFWINRQQNEEYDRYKGIEELMPFAKAVSAKSYDFDDDGNETTMDFPRIMKIVADAGYKGYVGIEYEGGRLGEIEGIHATKKLLTRCFEGL